jgi:4-alpha-glucanotransferase
MNEEQVYKLAAAAGLARDWISANGKPMQVRIGAMHAILDALGFPCNSEAQWRASMQRLSELHSEDVLPPLITCVVGESIQLPRANGLAGQTYRIELEESGDRLDGQLSDDVSHGAILPAIHQAGYHRLFIGAAECTLAVAPSRCFSIGDALHLNGQGGKDGARVWGLGVQLYSLRRPGDGGIGDFTSLSMLAGNLANKGAAALAISPVHAMFSADVTRFSPYGPSSRLFLNALHIDPMAVAGPQGLQAALAALGPDSAQALARLEQNDLIDWPASAALRLALLRQLFDQFTVHGDHDGFEAFRRESGTPLRDHARFEALHAWRLAQGESGDWRFWPAGLRGPLASEVERFAHEHVSDVRFHEFLQWQAARGLAGAQKTAREAGMPVGLIADLAVGADNGGSQAWSRQEEIINGLSVGAPPDVINTRGQSWGLGAFSPHMMKARGYGAYIEMLRATFKYAGGARIDHVLGLSRLWLVPHGSSAEDGAYLQYPMQDLMRLIALESWRHRAIVIGEDLGTVPAGFDQLLARAGLLGIRVLLFQRDHDRFLRPAEWSAQAMATTTTHDLPTMAGWWQGRDIDWRANLDLLEKGQTDAQARDARAEERRALWRALTEAGCASGDEPVPTAASAPLDACVSYIADTPAPLAILPIEDAAGLPEQPNLPGTVDSHPNWRRRLPQTVDNMLDDANVGRRLALMNKTRTYRGAS